MLSPRRCLKSFYGFKPNPAEMSFGSLMVHIAGSNRFRFAQVSGDTAPQPAISRAVNNVFKRANDIKPPDYRP